MNADPTSLDRLHDIVVPAPVPWWPPAPAWYWVLGFLLVVILVLVLEIVLRWQRNRYRREALSELAQVDLNKRASAVAKIAELLKRTALSTFPRESIASLTGSAWLAFLDRTGHTTAFQRNGEWFERATYDPRAANDLTETQVRDLAKVAHDWITHHRVESFSSSLACPERQSNGSLVLVPQDKDRGRGGERKTTRS